MWTVPGTPARGVDHDSMVGVTEGDKTKHVQANSRGRETLPVPFKSGGQGRG